MSSADDSVSSAYDAAASKDVSVYGEADVSDSASGVSDGSGDDSASDGYAAVYAGCDYYSGDVAYSAVVE